jgi:hypothetical protein
MTAKQTMPCFEAHPPIYRMTLINSPEPIRVVSSLQSLALAVRDRATADTCKDVDRRQSSLWFQSALLTLRVARP